MSRSMDQGANTLIDGIDGLENIVAAETVLSEVDGQAGRLVIRDRKSVV